MHRSQSTHSRRRGLLVTIIPMDTIPETSPPGSLPRAPPSPDNPRERGMSRHPNPGRGTRYQPIARERARSLLQQEEDVELVGECGDGAQAVVGAFSTRCRISIFLDVQNARCRLVRRQSSDSVPRRWVLRVRHGRTTSTRCSRVRSARARSLVKVLRLADLVLRNNLTHARAHLEMQTCGGASGCSWLLALVNDMKRRSCIV